MVQRGMDEILVLFFCLSSGDFSKDQNVLGPVRKVIEKVFSILDQFCNVLT